MSSSHLTENYITFLYLHSALGLSYVRWKELAFYLLELCYPLTALSSFLGKAALITTFPRFQWPLLLVPSGALCSEHDLLALKRVCVSKILFFVLKLVSRI